MTLSELNSELEHLKFTKTSLESAMKKFEGNQNVENYLCYSSLSTALKCVKESIENFEKREWYER